MYAVTSMPPEMRTRATLRSAEFGFFGVVVYTRVHTAVGCSSGIRDERIPTRRPFHVRQTRDRTTAVWNRPSRQKSEIPPKLVNSAFSRSFAQRARHSPRDGLTVVGVPNAARA